ncbi:receptor [Branchiostoma belcheri]|nr:receptor [Branchiostoma belcheri]
MWQNESLGFDGNVTAAFTAAVGPTEPATPELGAREIVVPVVYSVICLVGIIGNGLVIYLVWRHKEMRTVTNFYIVNLAVTDLAFLICCVPFSAAKIVTHSWEFGEFLCKFVFYFMQVTAQATCMTLAVLSLDRFWAIVKPFQTPWFRTPVGVAITTAIIWAVEFEADFTVKHSEAQANQSPTMAQPPVHIRTFQLAQWNGSRPCRTPANHRRPCRTPANHKRPCRTAANHSRPCSQSTPNNGCGEFGSVQKTIFDVCLIEFGKCIINTIMGTHPTTDKAVLVMLTDERQSEGSFLLSLPIAFFMQVLERDWYGRKLFCMEEFPSEDEFRAYIIYTVLISYVIPLTTSVVSHCLILRYLATMAVTTSVAQQHVMARKKRVTRMVATVVTLFALCWAPNHAANLWFAFKREGLSGGFGTVTVWLKISALCLSYANSCVNPFVYGIMGDSFRKAFAKSFGKEDSQTAMSAMTPRTLKTTKGDEIAMVKLGGGEAGEDKITVENVEQNEDVEKQEDLL